MLSKRIFILAFIAALFAPMAGQVFGTGGVLSSENRAPARFPALPSGLASLQTWPDQMTAWINDHFGFRPIIVRTGQRLERKFALRPVVDTKVVQGKENWLFFGGENVTSDFMGRRAYGSDEEVRSQLSAMAETIAFFEQKGARTLFVVPPAKATIYPEFMPDQMPAQPENTRLSQLTRQAGEVFPNLLVLTETLRNAKDEGQLYHRHDTHWNELGAFLAYREILSQLSDDPALKPLTRRSFKVDRRTRQGGDLAQMLGETARFQEDELHFVPKNDVWLRTEDSEQFSYQSFRTRIFITSKTDAPTLLIIGDSFSRGLIPFLQQHFSRVVFVHHQFGAFDRSVYDVYPSDYVLVEAAERVFQSGWGQSAKD